MIKAECFTNLDDYQREIWPTTFFIEPKINHKVTSKSGIRLSIVQIYHCYGYLKIELHKGILK